MEFQTDIQSGQKETILAFNPSELAIINRIRSYAKTQSHELQAEIDRRIKEIKQLAILLSHYPSIHSTSFLVNRSRSRQTLVDSLCSTPKDSRLLTFPTKVILGKSFLVAKFQMFSALTKIFTTTPQSGTLLELCREAALKIMFSIMAEDVYIGLLDDPEIDKTVKKDIAFSLTDLWENRFNHHCESFEPVLTSVWKARENLAPVFGTMLGASELFLLSLALDESWKNFLLARLDLPETSQSLEEFLFGIPYEKIRLVRREMRRKGIASIGRAEVEILAGKEHTFDSIDPRNFFASYTQRRNNAEARYRLNTDGPKKPLEDLYILFLFERMHQKEEG